jgi:hypothetical protein
MRVPVANVTTALPHFFPSDHISAPFDEDGQQGGIRSSSVTRLPSGETALARVEFETTERRLSVVGGLGVGVHSFVANSCCGREY